MGRTRISGSPSNVARKLVLHIYTLIGVAKTCYNMGELRDKMAEMYGKAPGADDSVSTAGTIPIVATCSR